MENKIGYLDIASSLGLIGDEVLFVSADLTRLALLCAKDKIPFNAQLFIQSFIDQLPNGTLVIPTYTDNLVGGMLFDVKKSKPNIGALAVAAFKNKTAFRTSDPFHSMAVWGVHVPLFQSITDKHTFGADSAFALLHQLKAKMVMIDLTLNQNFTFLHYCEEFANVSWRKLVKHKIKVVTDNGGFVEDDFWFFTRIAGFTNALNPLEKILLDEKLITKYEIGGVSVKMLEFSPVFDRIVMDITQNKGRSFSQFTLYEWLRAMKNKFIK